MAADPLTFQVHNWSVSLWFPTGFKISAIDTDPVKPVLDLCSVGQELVVLISDFLKNKNKTKTVHECSLYREQWNLFTPLPLIKIFSFLETPRAQYMRATLTLLVAPSARLKREVRLFLRLLSYICNNSIFSLFILTKPVANFSYTRNTKRKETASNLLLLFFL